MIQPKDIADKHSETAEGKGEKIAVPATPDASLTGLRPRAGYVAANVILWSQR
jgi:hypothetical protein